ncbi:MAG: hypothetical protein GY820_38870 [Gammaproteobacteria bacterium]|nr:hypothetical protein [Gammaproteobacteria bacterium]
MKQSAEVLTTWSPDLQPQIALDYLGSLTKCNDITAQPSENLTPNPNLYVVYIECEESVMDDIESDSDYVIIPGTREDIVEEEI